MLTRGTLIWSNTANGNNHTLHHKTRQLTLVVTKPDKDKTSFTDTKPTKSTAEQWQRAFEGLGPEWNESNRTMVGKHFRATRAATVKETGETAAWGVDHLLNEDGSYTLNDTFDITEQ